MVYLWAAIRTISILVGVLIALFILALAIGGVVQAFGYSFVVGCFALAAVSGAVSLFGHQLASVAKIPTTKRIGAYTRLCCGSIAALSLVVSLASYGYVAAQQMRGGAPSDFGPFADLVPGAKRAPGLDAGATWPGSPVRSSDGAAGPKVVTDPRTIAALNAAVACDEALIAAYKATRTARNQIPPPPPGYVLDSPVGPCARPVAGVERVIRFGGWEIHAPADTTDEAVVRVLDALSNHGTQ